MLVGEGVLDGVADPGLGREMDDAVGPGVAHQPLHQGRVGDVGADHAEALTALEPGGPGMLQRHLIVVVEDVDADDLFAPVQQALGHVHADEAGCAGDQNRHSLVSPARPSGRRWYS